MMHAFASKLRKLRLKCATKLHTVVCKIGFTQNILFLTLSPLDDQGTRMPLLKTVRIDVHERDKPLA